MLRETWDIWFLLMFVVVFLFGTAFFLGKVSERQKWQKAVPEQMQALCEECRSGGEADGLKTCDDVINQKDEGRNY
jgi:hypothetical protein